MKKLRVVMIGAGDRANAVIYPSFASLGNVEIAGICDIDESRRKLLRTNMGLRTATASAVCMTTSVWYGS